MLNTLRSFSLILVIFIHCHIYLVGYAGFEVPRLLVQLYYGVLSYFHPASVLAAISGFLFFKEQHGREVARAKYIKRIRSIFIPFAFWLTVLFIVNNLLIYFNNHFNANIFVTTTGSFSLLKYLQSFFYPELAVAKHLWYLNNLLIMFLLSPVILYINRSAASAVVLMIAIVLFYYTSYRMNNNEADHIIKYRFIIFYMIGAFLALNRNIFIACMNRKLLVSIGCLVIYAITMLFSFLRNDPAALYIINSITIPVIIFMIAYAALQTYVSKRETLYNRSNHFLLYVIHPFILTFLCKLIFFRAFTIPNYAIFLLLTLVLTFAVIRINDASYWIMNRYMTTLSRKVL